MIFCSLVIVGVLSKRRDRALRIPTTPRPASASASAMTPTVRLSLNYCRKAHGAGLGVGRQSPGRLLPGLVFGVLHSARLALRLKPFEHRTRSSGALLNITRRTLARRLPSTARSPRIARKLLLERGQTLDDRGFDLE